MAYDKQLIIDEIGRIAAENGGTPPGQNKFRKETGIGHGSWMGKYWVKWSEAIAEAGFVPNERNKAHTKEFLLQCLIRLIREKGRYPTQAEIRFERNNDSEFPAVTVFTRKGTKSDWASRVLEYCRENSDLEDVAELVEPASLLSAGNAERTDSAGDGFVYLMKSGKHYKIGFTNSVDRRRYELGPKLPHGIEPIHSIRTDDPAGIEAYWHRRFKDKHMNGEWFGLSPTDVATFKRRKSM